MKVKPLFSLVLCLTAIFLTACSHAAFTTGPPGGGGGPFIIGGTVTGLSGTGLTLQNGTETLTITGNSAFAFKKLVASGGTYSVTVTQPPTSPNQTCTVSNGNGKATANVTNVTVTCSTGTVAIGVTVAGLSGTGLVLQNGTDFLTITGTTTTNQFKVAVPFGQPYNVLVSAQPTSPAQTCTVSGGSGTATDGVAVNVQVTCSLGTLTIGGSVSGFAGGTGFVLQNNGGDNLSITKNGTFSFPILVPVNGAYKVTVFGQPSGPNQLCTVTNGTGTATANVNSISVVCPAVLHPIDVNVVGLLGAAGRAQLLDNGGDNLIVPKNGSYTFATPIAHGSAYNVTQFTASGTQSEECIVWGFSGTALSTPVNPVPLFDCGHNDWTFMEGTTAVDQFGMLPPPVPPPPAPPPAPRTCTNAPLPDTPGGTQYSSTWTASNNDLWILTGYGFTSTNPPIATLPFLTGEMWKHQYSQIYRGACASYWVAITPSNPPPPRWGAVTWTDSSGHLMLFGGQSGLSFMNDLWSYDTGTNAWTQIVPSSPVTGFDKPGVYGTQGVAAAGNWPGGRWGASGRSDASGNMWIFGGFGCDSTGPSCSNLLLNDLWKYSGGTWTWVKGANTGNQSGVYGTQGTAAAGNVPPGRQGSVAWVDNLGNFWMFGGFTTGTNGFNDLWKYDPVANQWTWMSGVPGATHTPGNYGTQGVAAASNLPGARWLSAAWSDIHGNLWLFGGQGWDVTGNGSLGDLWEYTVDTTTDPGNPAKIALNQWTWIKGPNSVSQPGIYGKPPDPVVWPNVNSNPGTRWSPSYWTTKHPFYGYQFWMFGGEGCDATCSTGKGYSLLNDLWRYVPYP